MIRRPLLAPSFLAMLAAPALPAAPHSSARSGDAYVLVHGGATTMSGSFGDLAALRSKHASPFLWFRRSGRRYLISDARVIARAEALFDPLRALEPEQEETSRLEAALDEEEEALDREEERLDLAREDLDDDSAGSGAEAAEVAALDRGRHALDARRAELRPRQAAVERRERDLERREEALEREAERGLWRLLDASVADGSAVEEPLAR
jgi:bla regulator protein blaR1